LPKTTKNLSLQFGSHCAGAKLQYFLEPDIHSTDFKPQAFLGSKLDFAGLATPPLFKPKG
jgi:hypothetical protein